MSSLQYNTKTVFFDLDNEKVQINYKSHQENNHKAANEIKLLTKNADIRINTCDLPKNRLKLSHVLKYL